MCPPGIAAPTAHTSSRTCSINGTTPARADRNCASLVGTAPFLMCGSINSIHPSCERPQRHGRAAYPSIATRHRSFVRPPIE